MFFKTGCFFKGEKRRLIAATVAALLAIAACLAGCGSDQASDPGSAPGAAPEARVESSESANKPKCEKKSSEKSSGTSSYQISKQEHEKVSQKENSQSGKSAKPEKPDKPAKSAKLGKSTKPAKSGKQSKSKSKSANASKTAEKRIKYCCIKITCRTLVNGTCSVPSPIKRLVPSSGIILDKTKVKIKSGDTVFDITKRVTKNNGIHMSYQGATKFGTVYVEGINNIYEKDVTSKSGWLYFVNGSPPDRGCSAIKVSNGDTIEWAYTTDLGKDL